MKKNKISALAKQYGVVLVFVLLIRIGALLSETCLSAQNLINILKQYAPIVVISCGTTLVIISGQIDGFVITHYKLAPFIVTLAMQFMARFGGPFPPIHHFEKWDIHKVCPHFSKLDSTKNLSPNALDKLCGTALNLFYLIIAC